MGVSGLWSLLTPVGNEVDLQCCRGKRLAVDLSSWIVQCSSVANSKQISTKSLCYRGIFLRTLNLLSLGISLVFVIDGPNAPAMKKRTNREQFYYEAMEYKQLLTDLGLPVLECDGEAEKMCAELNHLNLVDGVLTNDGDALIYGALTVYKGLFRDSKNYIAVVYNMDDITRTLNFSRRDLVAFALLSSGDFSDGVRNVREKKFTELMNEFKSNNIKDALDRLISWSSNTDLDLLSGKQKSLTGKKTKHCTKCLHEGTKQEHKISGCNPCQVDLDCKESNTPGHPSCLCEYHVVEEAVRPFKTELKIRDMALQSGACFPNQSVIQEYLQPLPQTLTGLNFSLRTPNFKAVCDILNQKLHFSSNKTMSYLVPATIKMAFHGHLPDVTIKPIQILKARTINYEKCFEIRWEKLDQDEFSNESSYTFPLSQALFTSNYPEMVDEFMSTSNRAVKRKSESQKQSTMTSFFKTVKHAQLSSSSSSNTLPDGVGDHASPTLSVSHPGDDISGTPPPQP